ncbi:MAG: protein S100 [Clostridia bacterium]|nr:protein S100 [Clostridia bacterium]
MKAHSGQGGRIDTFTKLAVAVILVNAAAWVWCSYGLAYLGRYEIAESLSEKAIETIIGTFVTYALKSGIENVSKYGIRLPSASQSNAQAGERRDY